MSSINIKTIDRPGPFDLSSNSTLALCPGDSYITRFDFEIAFSTPKNRRGFFDPQLNVVSIFATCSDKSPKQAIFLPSWIYSDAPRALFQGPDAPNGIREMVVNGAGSVTAIGYADAFVGILSTAGSVWRQVDSEYAPCALKGIEATKKWIGGGVDKVRLHFNCPPNATVTTPPPPTWTLRSRLTPGVTHPAELRTQVSASWSELEASSGNNSTLIIVIGSGVGGAVLLLIGFILLVRNRRQLHK